MVVPPIRRPHVAVFAFPFGTHAAPLLTLLAKLAAAAPDAAFSFFNTAKSNAASAAALAGCEALANVTAYEVWDGVPEGRSVHGGGREAVELFLEAGPANLTKAIAEAEDAAGRVTCIVGDAFLCSAAEVAAERAVPWVSLWTSATFSLVAHFHTETIRQTVGVRPQDVEAKRDDSLEFVPTLSAFRVRDLMEGIVSQIDGAFPRHLQRMAEMSPRAAAVVFNTFDALEATFLDYLRTLFKACLTVGPLSLLLPPPPQQDSHACLPWLDCAERPASVAYISFGSFLALPAAETAALAAGLEASGVRFLWSLKDAARADLPPGFLERTAERALVVPWVPQTAVLAHRAVGAFVTHCGWNSVMESITAGVPMVCRPIYVDQRFNARAVTEVWRIGVAAEGGEFTEKGARRSLEAVLSGEKGKAMRVRVRALKEAAESAVADGGSSCNSLAVLSTLLAGGENSISGGVAGGN